ncbi:MAG: MgtC/SapB family protein [Armatimonadetes bacterium]|nr:MgtC/SapB family protein [Armatimonadota bacterium]
MDIPWDLTGRMLLAVVLGALIGLERELHGHPAGLRTHILVSLGSAIAALVSLEIGGEPGRVAAQVVTGVGFLGAGAIIRDGASIRGLTTAASIWTTAMVGLAAGVSLRTASLAVIATAMILLVLWWLHHLERRLDVRGLRTRILEVEIADVAQAMAGLMECATIHGVTVHAIEVDRARSGEGRLLHIRLRFPRDTSREALISEIAQLPGVRAVSLD